MKRSERDVKNARKSDEDTEWRRKKESLEPVDAAPGPRLSLRTISHCSK